ncbi:MAG: ATPase [Muribaculaceae bacterium]|nr:ATPase [Muribaculaceae bacterium]
MRFHRFSRLSALLTMTTAAALSSQGALRLANGLEFTPIGTLLLDGAIYASPQKEYFGDGAAIPEVRIGSVVKYDRWSAKIEIGTAYNKVALRDLYFQYDFSDSDLIRLGAQVHHFGYMNSTAACNRTTMIETVNNSVFNSAHIIGVQYFHTDKHIYGTACAYVEPDATAMVIGEGGLKKMGFGLRGRLAWHPWAEEGKMLQIGMSGDFTTPQHDRSEGTHEKFTYSANFPTKVDQVKAIGVTVDRARTRWQFTPELMAAYGRAGLESQYYFSQVNRLDGLPAFRAYGAYVTLRGIAIGKDYTYSRSLGGIATPAPKTLELVASYNYTCLSDASASLYGGRLSDLSVNANYYINRWMTARLRYGYTWIHDRTAEGPDRLGALQARLQIIF